MALHGSYLIAGVDLLSHLSLYLYHLASGPGRGVLAELGEKDGSMVTVKSGRFGDYLNWKKVNAKLPSQYMDEPDSMPLEEAWELIEEKAALLPKAKKGSSKKKDSDLPPAPKRPKSAYMYFCTAKRPEVAERGKSLGEVTKQLAAMWAETSEEDRKQYDELAGAGKAEYQKEKAAWEEKCRKLQGGKGKRTSDPSAPKRARSAYIYFCNAMRPEVSQRITKLGDISKELARMWGETSDRTEFIALAEADKARYEADMAEHQQGKDGSATNDMSSSKVKGVPKRIRVVNGSEKGKTKRKSASKTKKKGTKRAPSAYMIFCRETRHEILDENGEKLPLGETTKRLAQRWKDIDPDTRAKFVAIADLLVDIRASSAQSSTWAQEQTPEKRGTSHMTIIAPTMNTAPQCKLTQQLVCLTAGAPKIPRFGFGVLTLTVIVAESTPPSSSLTSMNTV